MLPAVFLAYAAFMVLYREFFVSTPAFFYPPAGIAAAAFILSRRAVWPGIAVAVGLAELAMELAYRNLVGLSLVYAVSTVVEALVGASLVLAWCGGRPDLRERRDFLAFIVGACLAGPVVGGLLGGTALAVNGGLPWLITVATWAIGDGIGVVVIASPILLWADQAHLLRRYPWDTVGVLFVTAALSVVTYWSAVPLSILVLPVLAWAAFRLDMLGTALAGAVTAVMGSVMTTRGYGLFAAYGLSPGMQLGLTQVSAAAITLVAMLLARETGARLRALRERDTERRERLRLESLARLADQLSAALTPEEIGRSLLAQVLNEASAQALTLDMVSADGRRLECVAMEGFPQDAASGMPMSQRGVATDVIRSGAPVEFNSLAAYRGAYPDSGLVGIDDDAGSIVGWPLSFGGEPFGVLVLLWPVAKPLDSSQRAYISSVATMVSQALVRAKIYADEHARAAVLLSVAQPDNRAGAAVEHRALYWPSDAVHGLGGDWYSVMALPDGKTYLAVGDVIGHGLSSVEDMARLRNVGDAYAHLDLPPSRILTGLNRFAGNRMRGEFATCLVALFGPEDYTLSYSSAGHLPALLRRAHTGEVLRLSQATGPPLGPFADSAYEQSALRVAAGDVLVMYTDGLVEDHDDGLTAGIAHLEQAVRHRRPEDLLDCQALARELTRTPIQDDVCMVVVVFGPGTA